MLSQRVLRLRREETRIAANVIRERVGVFKTGHSVYVKEDSLNASWTHEFDGCEQIALAGNRIVVLTKGGAERRLPVSITLRSIANRSRILGATGSCQPTGRHWASIASPDPATWTFYEG